jgi:hypothetical protein
LENLRSFLVDLEALAHAAWETLDRLPYLPTPPSSRSEGQELESRLNYGRLQALVTATASSAKEVLLACSEMVENAYEPPDTDEEDDEGSGSGGSGTSGSSRKGEPGVSGPGNDPQAQAITDSSGAMPQVRKDHVEVSFADIDDGPGDPPGGLGGLVPPAVAVPQALRSRVGIVLDTATVPPGLTPLVLADSARIVLQPAAMA